MSVRYPLNRLTAGGQTAYRKGEYFRKELTVDNSSAAVWTNIVVAATGQSSVTGAVYVATTQEQFGYDADGNLTSDGRWTYTWDAENRLVNMTSLSTAPAGSKLKLDFAYDWKSRRIQKLVSTNSGSAYVPQYTNYFAYERWNLVATFNPQLSALNCFTWGVDLSGSMQGAGGVGGLLVVNDASNGAHYAAFDGNGNVAALINASGTNSAVYEYGPFGEVVRATGPAAKANPLRFSTKYQDDETDSVYYGYRYFSASAGRWIGRDPLGENGSDNIYEFAANGPETFSDRNGLDFGSWIGHPGYNYSTPSQRPPTPTPASSGGYVGPSQGWFGSPGGEMYNINSPQFALAPQPPDTHNPGEVKQYGKDWFSGNAPNAILGPDSDWTHAMQNSTAMAIDRVRAREMLDNFCKPLNGAHFPRIFGEFSGWVGLEGERAFRMKAVGVG